MRKLECIPVNFLAKSLLAGSVGFWNSLVTWVGNFYNRLLVKVELSNPGVTQSERKEHDLLVEMAESEAWELIIQVLTDIFQEIAIKRNDGEAAQSMKPGLQRASIVLYATLQAHNIMNELADKNFERHPCLSPSLNNFCIAARASLNDIHQVEAKLSHLEKVTSGVQAKVDKSLSGKGKQKDKEGS